jgi:hypothetical protein
VGVTHHSLFTGSPVSMLVLLWCNLALLLAASVLAFPTAELAFAMQHGSHGGTISAWDCTAIRSYVTSSKPVSPVAIVGSFLVRGPSCYPPSRAETPLGARMQRRVANQVGAPGPDSAERAFKATPREGPRSAPGTSPSSRPPGLPAAAHPGLRLCRPRRDRAGAAADLVFSARPAVVQGCRRPRTADSQHRHRRRG